MVLQAGSAVLLWMCMMFFQASNAASSGTRRDQSMMLSVLLREYDMRVLPETPVNVTYDMALVRIGNLDETNNVLQFSAFVKMTWSDNRLTWDPALFGDTTFIRMSKDHLWLPKAKPFAQILEEETMHVSVQSDGTVHYHCMIRLAVSCDLDFANYPFDSRSCNFKVDTWSYDDTEVNLTLMNNTPDVSFEDNLVWNVTSFQATRDVTVYECCPDTYVTLKYRIDLKRRPNGYTIRVIAPSVLTSLLILFCFFIPPTYGERLVVCAVLLLAVLMQMLYFNFSVPVHSADAPFMGHFLCFSVFLAFFVVLESVVTINIARGGWGSDMNDGEVATRGSSKMAKMRISKILDMICFAVFTFIFAVAGGVILHQHPG